jgi:hypothetical protein
MRGFPVQFGHRTGHITFFESFHDGRQDSAMEDLSALQQQPEPCISRTVVLIKKVRFMSTTWTLATFILSDHLISKLPNDRCVVLEYLHISLLRFLLNRFMQLLSAKKTDRE